MNKRQTRGALVLAALLAGALALPGVAAADGGRGWGGDGRGDWHGERHRDRGRDRGWGESRHHDHDRWEHDRRRGHGYREGREVAERPVRRYGLPHPFWLPGLSVIFNSW